MLVIGGGHWAALQTVAWAQMVVDYTRDSGSLRQGVADTFDGAHPCELCRQISAGIAKENRSERQKSLRDERLGKITLAPIAGTIFSAPPAPPGVWLPVAVHLLAGRLADTPPVPPPRRTA